jgi:hypothetical protein
MLLAGADEETLRAHRKSLAQGAAEGVSASASLWTDAIAKIENGVTTFTEVQRLGLELPWSG